MSMPHLCRCLQMWFTTGCRNSSIAADDEPKKLKRPNSSRTIGSKADVYAEEKLIYISRCRCLKMWFMSTGCRLLPWGIEAVGGWAKKQNWSCVWHPLFGLIKWFLTVFEVRIKSSWDYTFTAGPDLMWSSSSASNSDDFPFFWTLYCSSRTRVTAVWSSINICWLKFQQILTKL